MGELYYLGLHLPFTLLSFSVGRRFVLPLILLLDLPLCTLCTCDYHISPSPLSLSTSVVLLTQTATECATTICCPLIIWFVVRTYILTTWFDILLTFHPSFFCIVSLLYDSILVLTLFILSHHTFFNSLPAIVHTFSIRLCLQHRSYSHWTPLYACFTHSPGR